MCAKVRRLWSYVFLLIIYTLVQNHVGYLVLDLNHAVYGEWCKMSMNSVGFFSTWQCEKEQIAHLFSSKRTKTSNLHAEISKTKMASKKKMKKNHFKRIILCFHQSHTLDEEERNVKEEHQRSSGLVND